MTRLSARALTAAMLLCAVAFTNPAWGESQKMQAQQARKIQVVMTEFRFEPAQITVQPGEPLQVTVVNRGNTVHNIVFRLPDGNVGFQKPIPPGGSATLQLTAPNQPGQYMFYCPVGQHHQQGMHGQLVVQTAEQ